MTKLRYLIATHTRKHTRTLTDKAVSQTRSTATKCKRDTRRLLRLAAATCCCCTATTAFNVVQFAESSGVVYAVGHMAEGVGEMTGSELPIQLEICASAAPYRKTLPMLNVCVTHTPVPSLRSQHIAQHTPCMQHCCNLNTRTCRATNLRVSLLALRCGILFARESVRVC